MPDLEHVRGVCGVLSRIIGPSKFDSTADAALDALKETQNRSLCNDMEYSGIVCKDTNGKYFASKAETDNLRKESYPLKRNVPQVQIELLLIILTVQIVMAIMLMNFFQVAIKIL